MNPTYEEQMTAIFNKALRDEISATMLYHRMAEEVSGTEMEEFAETLHEHGDEEYEHFKEILAYAVNHDIKIALTTDAIALGIPTTNIIETDINAISNLETMAYNDYRNAALLAKEYDDLETQGFFEEKMNDERRHSDEILKLSKIQKTKPLSFSQFILQDTVEL